MNTELWWGKRLAKWGLKRPKRVQEDNIKMTPRDIRLQGLKCSESCPMLNYDINSVEPQGYVTTERERVSKVCFEGFHR